MSSTGYFPPGDSCSFPFVKDEPDEFSLDHMAWVAPRSPGVPDYPQFNMAQPSKVHPDFSTSIFGAQCSSQYLSPVSQGTLHSPQMDNEPYEPMERWNYAMPSPGPEYDLTGPSSYSHQDPSRFDSCYINPRQVNSGSRYEQSGFDGSDSSMNIVKQDPDTFAAGLGFTDGFSQTLSSNHVAVAAGDSVMLTQPSASVTYLTSQMEIDRGVPATPPKEYSLDNTSSTPRNNAASRKRNARGRPKPSQPNSDRPKSVRCKSCDKAFPDSGLLEDHVQQAHARPLVCVFGYAGCTATFGSKNEWKRHTLSQHIILTYWLCTDEDCVRANPRTGGTVFNRKDLFTQHVRRMHVPDMYKDVVARKEHHPDWDRMLRRMQENAERKRCELPTYMECPAPGCVAEFRGANAWDDRMEHVAKHLDGSGSPGEPHIVFGGDGDRTLTEWAKRPDVNIVRRVGGDRWELVVPLKTTAKEAGSTRKLGAPFRSAYGDEDAIGEPE
ncbi:hypothetical protein VUR80DRAFT_858 [Thermomyces stellatus]